MIRLFLILQSVLFLGAASLHFGFFGKGYEHTKARIAETIIGLVLVTGFILTLFSPDNQQVIARTVQAFALFGTCIGIFTIIVGVGPRTRIDIILHLCMITLLIWGIILTV